MNRGSMSKQISTAPKSKSKKVKKMAFGGLTPPPGFQQAVGPQQAVQQGTQVTAAGTQPDQAQMAQMQAQIRATQGRGGQPIVGEVPGTVLQAPGTGPMPRDPRPGAPTQVATPLKPGMPGRPGMGDMPMPRIGLPGKPGKPGMPGRPGMGDMPRIGLPGKPGPALGGGPGMPGSVLRGGPALMPAMAMAKGGKAKKMAKGGKIDGCCMKGHTKGTMR